MTNRLEEDYFRWLYSQIGAVSDVNPNHSFWILTEMLYETPFDIFVSNDVNRALDGTYLRTEFGVDEGDSRLPEECTLLEMLIALSHRVEEEAYGTNLSFSTENWFWRLLDNAGLRKYNDAVLSDNGPHQAIARDIIRRIRERDYEPSGLGGLFPLRNWNEDQRDVEIWYQMAAYILENTDITD